MRLNLKLKIAILASGQPQRQVAAVCGIRESRFSDIVRGWIPPRDGERRAIADALGKPVEDLFALEEDERRHAEVPV